MEVYNTELHHLLPLNLWPADDTAALFEVSNVTRGLSEGELNGRPLPPTFPPELKVIADKVREEYFGKANVTNSSQQVVEVRHKLCGSNTGPWKFSASRNCVE